MVSGDVNFNIGGAVRGVQIETSDGNSVSVSGAGAASYFNGSNDENGNQSFELSGDRVLSELGSMDEDGQQPEKQDIKIIITLANGTTITTDIDQLFAITIKPRLPLVGEKDVGPEDEIAGLRAIEEKEKNPYLAKLKQGARILQDRIKALNEDMKTCDSTLEKMDIINAREELQVKLDKIKQKIAEIEAKERPQLKQAQQINEGIIAKARAEFEEMLLEADAPILLQDINGNEFTVAVDRADIQPQPEPQSYTEPVYQDMDGDSAYPPSDEATLPYDDTSYSADAYLQGAFEVDYGAQYQDVWYSEPAAAAAPEAAQYDPLQMIQDTPEMLDGVRGVGDGSYEFSYGTGQNLFSQEPYGDIEYEYEVERGYL